MSVQRLLKFLLTPIPQEYPGAKEENGIGYIPHHLLRNGVEHKISEQNYNQAKHGNFYKCSIWVQFYLAKVFFPL